MSTSVFYYSYTIKLFDRSVDLAQFDTNIPLYVMARAWMLNKPYSRYYLGTEKAEEQRQQLQTIPEHVCKHLFLLFKCRSTFRCHMVALEYLQFKTAETEYERI